MEHQNDTLEALLAGYVAGSLPMPAHVLVGAHLEIKESNRSFVRNLESIAAGELMDMEPVALSNSPSMLDSILSNPTDSIRVPERQDATLETDIFPSSLRNFVGHTAKTIPWRTKMPGFKEYHIGEFDGCEVSMFWIRGGRAIPEHTHEGSELTLVLDGGFSDGIGHYDRGDISIADESIDHRPVADEGEPCIGFAITTAPLKLTGSIGQIFADIIGR